MSRPGTWYTIDVKLARIEGAEREPWVEAESKPTPSPSEVAAFIRERIEGARDIYRNFEVTSVSQSTSTPPRL